MVDSSAPHASRSRYSSAEMEENARNAREHAPLLLAASTGREDIVGSLLEEPSCDFETCSCLGWTPLHAAAYHGHLNVVQNLVRVKRTDVNARTTCRFEITPLGLAAAAGHSDVVCALLSSPGIDVTGNSVWSPLHVAAFGNHVAVIRALLMFPRSIANARDARGWTPLHVAARYGYADSVAVLLEEPSIDANPWTAEEVTPLHMAVHFAYEDVVRALLSAGKSIAVDARASQNWTPLHLAAYHGHASIAELLLQASASTEALTEDGWSPLHLAARYGREAVVAQLIKKLTPAQCTTNTARVWTPLHLAAQQGWVRIAAILLAGAPDESQAAALWSYRCTIDARTHYGSTALHFAAHHGNADMVDLLLKAGAALIANDKGLTPTDVAAARGHASIVARFLALNPVRTSL